MEQNITRLSRLMRISWQIQRTKRKTRSAALVAAWAILTNEDITVQYLTRKLNHDRPLTKRAEGQFVLFSNS
ncbi:hypothetical protein CJD36_004490 [Flavipsychrobacter stenotrophus]|uniref:Uncharacterized protein n=2 Tax=Flavipsychrobacter stenotrophus TaxID=2077091 RepID=A0A2S7T2D6_9BACT|nr:hypothetical protein CJD36_004490 [Flavipsychrobacter stenotrophus]